MMGLSVNVTKDLWEVVKKTAIHWNEAGPWRQSAILAYYSIFSLPALLLIIIVISGYFFGEDAVAKELSAQISAMIGKETARSVEIMIANAAQTGSSTTAMLIGIGLLLFGATSVFYHLQLSLNRIWGVMPKPKQAFLKYVKDRLLSFGLVLAIGFLLLVSFIVTSLLAVLGDWLVTHWPTLGSPLVTLTHYALSLLVTTTLFALMFKILPDAIIRWRSVWIGAFLTAVLFAIGQYGLSMYFSKFSPASVYGAAGAIILILIWTSYVALILLFGAEFTRQWANKFGHGITPKGNAVLITDDKEAVVELPE
ncbi:MAG: YihY/virulence factor BrkB family protein [Bacteroidales bacterium]|nr:YihY/virulence factor BrkB family protein [Bacteroidales bacterium]